MILEDKFTFSTPSCQPDTTSYLHFTECNGRQCVLTDRGQTEGKLAISSPFNDANANYQAVVSHGLIQVSVRV